MKDAFGRALMAYHEQNQSKGHPPGLVKICIGLQGEFDDWFDSC